MDYRRVGELVALLRARQVSAGELVEDAIARIEAGDQRLNAVVVRDFDRAREAARAAEAALARGEDKPLLGVPMTVKESFNVAGLPTTWGFPGAGRKPAEDDAVAVSRLKQAGAIILGKTNVPVFLDDWQSANPIYGVTNNPWDVTRSPGGSSGGAAAALAAGYVPLEFGSDIGGSLRVPAHFCGVFAHKPTYGLVPARGHQPPGTPSLSVAAPADMAVVGPMARSADDLMRALDVTAGPDDADATAYTLRLPPPRHEALADYRVLVLDEHPLAPTGADTRAALATLAERLEGAGCKVGRSSALLPDLAKLGVTYFKLLMSFMGANIPEGDYARARDRADALADDDTGLQAAGARGLVLSHRDWVHCDRVRAAIAHQWRLFFRDWDVVLCPVTPTAAFPHDRRDFDERTITVDGEPVPYNRQMLWITLATLTGLPATAMPLAHDKAGLPLGMQIIGPYLEDRTPITFAGLVERAFGGFRKPPGY